MKNEVNRALVAKKNAVNRAEQSWTKVLLEIIIKILTLGFYHLERHRSNNGVPK